MNKTKRIFGKAIIKAAGVTFDERQGKLWNVYKNIQEGYATQTMLRREPNNEYDKNAIAIIVKCGRTAAKIGYVPANKAVWLAPKMDNGMVVRAYGGKVNIAGKGKPIGYEFNVAHELSTEDLVYETIEAE